MKMLTVDRRRYAIHRANASFLSGMRQKGKLAEFRRSNIGRVAKVYRDGKVNARAWLERNGKQLPTLFCIEKNTEEVIAFVQRMRIQQDDALERYKHQSSGRKHPAKWFDFSSIGAITTSAALILAAEFDRGRRIVGKKMYAIDVHKWNPTALNAMRQIGLLELLEIDPRAAISKDEKGQKVILPMRSGSQTEGAEIQALQDEIATIAIEAVGPPTEGQSASLEVWREKLLKLYLILLEAMDNVAEHAYRGTPDPFSSRRWYMTAAVEKDRKRLTVAIYDQGLTIPVTLPNWRNYPRVARIWEKIQKTPYAISDQSRDGLALQAAMKVAVSSTQQEHRGKGLPLMVEFLDACKDGRLRIISRAGILTVQKGRQPKAESLGIALPGTLIEWEVFL